MPALRFFGPVKIVAGQPVEGAVDFAPCRVRNVRPSFYGGEHALQHFDFLPDFLEAGYCIVQILPASGHAYSMAVPRGESIISAFNMFLACALGML